MIPARAGGKAWRAQAGVQPSAGKDRQGA